MFFCVQNTEHTFCLKGGEFMKVFEIRTRIGRSIPLLIEVSKQNLNKSVDSIVSTIEQVVIAEMYEKFLENKDCIFYNIEILTYYNELYKTRNFPLSISNAEMIVTKVYCLEASLRMEIENELLHSILE